MDFEQAREGLTRRDVMTTGAGAAVAVVAGAAGPTEAATRRGVEPVELSWLGGAPATVGQGVMWGMPWPRGALPRVAPFQLKGATGTAPVQTWPLAYWPDGSLKWTGHAAAGPLRDATLRLEPGAARVAAPVAVRTDGDVIRVSTGDFSATIAQAGPILIPEASLGGRTLLRDGRLVCLLRDSSDPMAETARMTSFDGHVTRATVEQSGPIRAVVRLEGMHRAADRSWLPFSIRIAAHAGCSTLQLTHTMTFDGAADRDFICGLGIRFDTPFADDLHNRHIRFSGEAQGLWSEAVRNIPGWTGGKFKHADRFQDQLAGKPVPTLAQMDAKSREQLAMVPSWDSFKLFQGSPDYFTIAKRTNGKSSWVHADHGHRASGLGYVGGASGGVAFGLRDFWQLHPTGIDVHGATGDAATTTLWLWSPDAGAMDLRHYDDKAHGLEMTYEDVQPEHSTPMGIARTHQVTLQLHAATPAREALVAQAQALSSPPLLVAAPRHYHDIGAFGTWSLPDRTHPSKAQMEHQLDAALDWYVKEVDRRRWYGFWDYGDVRHTYDNDRHDWRYDVGGYAWANSELAPDLWLWYSFLRSGRADLFRMAEAMTRHTSEVDMHHLGRFAPLGTRHNVSHWGDGAKEARISQAALRRIYHYLTADERTGDLMRMVVDADHATVANDPLRQIIPDNIYPTHARSGPDWLAFAGNWMTEWERTGDTQWRDKILRGMDDIARLPKGMFSGPPLGYDPKTAHLHNIDADFKYSYHLATIFGGAEVMFELETLVDSPAFMKSWLQFCQYYNAPEAERRRDIDDRATDNHFTAPEWHARLTAYAAHKTGNRALARRAWEELLGEARAKYSSIFPFATSRIAPPLVLEPVDEVVRVSTNHVAQWSLNVIEVLALAGDDIPNPLPGSWGA
ncbi:Tat pathway signal sequence domain protein [Sphingobium aquiterrae]|uniref:exo-rhamnogalacturonan lyase family protein n=1 Tax=Sphingobium aquiterrae TaxID=2038656 RepID=UPI00301752CD